MTTPYKLCPRCRNAGPVAGLVRIRGGNDFRTPYQAPRLGRQRPRWLLAASLFGAWVAVLAGLVWVQIRWGECLMFWGYGSSPLDMPIRLWAGAGALALVLAL